MSIPTRVRWEGKVRICEYQPLGLFGMGKWKEALSDRQLLQRVAQDDGQRNERTRVSFSKSN